MSGLVRVVFNGEERLIAAGLTVRNLLSPGELARVGRRELAVVDARGNVRGLGGALLDGAVLALRPRPTP